LPDGLVLAFKNAYLLRKGIERMQALDILMRGAAIGIAIHMAISMMIGTMPRRKTCAIVSFFSMIACYLIISSPSLNTIIGSARPIFVLGATLVPVAFTWAVLEILFDEIWEKWIWLLLAAFTVVAALFGKLIPEFFLIRGLLVIVLYLGLLVLAVRTGPDDLVEKRRRFRKWFVACMALLGAITSIIEIGFEEAGLPAFIYPLQAITFLMLSVIFGLWFFTLSPDIWPTRRDSKASNVAVRENPIVAKLMAAIEAGAWREEGLTVGGLASQLGIPEHKLRTTINQDLKFRNFSTFINGHRIEAAMLALDDPDQMGKTILEIAYEIGFSSLGPFNKAFRTQTGISPREYRARVQ
jgi:AraC-like DNA-binding protein